MKATVVINPIAGPGRSRTLEACAALARDSMGRGGYEVAIRITATPEDAQRFSADAVNDGHELVVAWGGDGTVNGVGAALAGTGVAMAIIPGGSGNGLARDLGVPLNPAAAFEVAASGATRAIDAGELNGFLFFNVAGIGVDASIARRMSAPGARRGLLGYVIATFRELPAYSAREYTIAIAASDSPPITTAAVLIALANSRQYGNGALIAPHARLDDGKLEVVVLRPQSLLRIASRIPSFFNGTLRPDETLLMRTTAAASISCSSDIPFHVDGEPRDGGTTVELRTRQRVLLVKVKA